MSIWSFNLHTLCRLRPPKLLTSTKSFNLHTLCRLRPPKLLTNTECTESAEWGEWPQKWAVQSMTKPTKWHMHPTKTQISLGIRPIWSESSLCAQCVAKDPSSCGQQRLGAQVILLVLSCCSSNYFMINESVHVMWPGWGSNSRSQDVQLDTLLTVLLNLSQNLETLGVSAR